MKQEDIFVNADDFGMSTTVNEAIDYGFKSGILNRTTIMVNMPAVKDAVNKAKVGGYVDNIGLHLNLDEGEPLTDPIKSYSLYGDKSFWNNKKNLLFISDKNLRKALRCEISAQMEKYVELGFSLMHLDSHHHFHTMPSILPIVIGEAKRHGFVSMRISRNIGSHIGIVKRILKGVTNMCIKFNFNTTKYFGSISDYNISKINNDSTVEVMVHPEIVNGRIVDIINRKKLKYNELSLIF